MSFDIYLLVQNEYTRVRTNTLFDLLHLDRRQCERPKIDNLGLYRKLAFVIT